MKTSIKLKLNKDRQLKCGKYPLVFQIIHRRQRRLIYTGIKLREESFNGEKERVISNVSERFKRGEIGALNERIATLRRNIHLMIDHLTFSKDAFTADDITHLYVRKQHDKYVITFSENIIEESIAAEKFGTARNYQYTISALQNFANTDMLRFEDIDYRFLKNYEKFLLKRNLKPNSVTFYLRNFRAIYNKALGDGIFELPVGGSPFSKMAIRISKTVKRALPTDAIRKVMQLDLSENAELEFSRDLFMFSFYMRGMSFVDIVNLKHENIENKIIHYYRAKTKSLINVGVTEQLQAIIDRYRGDSCYVLPCLSESNTKQQNYTRYRTLLARHNRNLKEIASMVGINSLLTTYVARHSWATAAKEKGVSIAIISESLGHSTESVTNIYLKSFDQNILDEVNRNIAAL